MYLRQDILDLTPRELALLRALMTKPGHAVAKECLFEVVFPGEDHVQYEAIESWCTGCANWPIPGSHS